MTETLGTLTHADRLRLEALRYAVTPEAASYLAIMRTFTGGISGLLSDQSAAEVQQRLADEQAAPNCAITAISTGPGLAIANRLILVAGVRAWRMSAADYTAAARPDGPRLAGAPVTASWDGELTDTMARRGVAVHEESVLDQLLDTPLWDGR